MVAEADVGSDDDLEAKAIAGKMLGFRAERRIASTIADLLSAPKPADRIGGNDTIMPSVLALASSVSPRHRT